MKFTTFNYKDNNSVFNSKSYSASTQTELSYMEKAFRKDKDPNTTNIHAIAMKHMLSIRPTDINIINIIQKTNITQTELDSLTSIKPSKVQLIDCIKEIRNAIRIVLGKGRSAGVYVFTNNKNGKQYVGSSTNISSRLTTYFNSNYKYNSRLLLNDFKEFVYSDYTLQIFLIPNDFSSININIVRIKTLVLEQYYIFTLNPSLNTIKVAGCPTGLSKPVFVYLNNTLIFEAPSFSVLSEITGISVITLRETSLIFGKITISSTKVIKVNENLLDPKDFRAIVDSLRQRSYTRKLSRITSNSVAKTSIAITATNLLTNEKITCSSIKEISRIFTKRNVHVSYSTIQRYVHSGNIYKNWIFTILSILN